MNASRTVLSLIALSLIAGSAQANPQLYDKTVRSTAWVISPVGKEGKAAWGGGALVDAKKRWVLTNWHVVEERNDVIVFFPTFQNGRCLADPNFYLGKEGSKTKIEGKVIARDKKRDMALIELKSLPASIAEFRLAPASARPAETVHAIGNSGVENGGGVLWRYSKGEVRQVYKAKVKNKMPDGKGTLDTDFMMLETQIPTNSGDSGGPVVNDKGELVGLTQGCSPSLRLVSHSVDVSEIRSFLKTASTPTSTVATKK
ncbi:MAG: serine protease [Gemmataceae bacterium]|nr:serine protease [Gemmataceae bacterium]